MRLNYNFKVGSLFEWRGIPVRVFILVIFILSLVAYYCAGFLSVNHNLPSKKGIVEGVRIFQDESGWEAYFTLKGDSSCLYWQSYATKCTLSLLFPPKYKVDGFIIHPGGTIRFYVDKTKKCRRIVSFWFPSSPEPFKSDRTVYTEGLTVNGETIADPLVVSFTRSWIDSVGNIPSIFLFLTLGIFGFDYLLWSDQKDRDKKLKSFFASRNRFIQQSQLSIKSEKHDGYEKLSDEELATDLGIIGLTEINDLSTGFKADVYKDEQGNYVLAYRGAYSDPNHPENDLVHDWSKEWTDENIQQGVCMGSG